MRHWLMKICPRNLVLSSKGYEGLSNREGPKLEKIGGGRSGGTLFGGGVTAAEVTWSGLADRSVGSGQ